MLQRRSVATRLFVLVFGGSVLWSALTTTAQLFFEYQGTRATVDASLEDLYLATHTGLEAALWAFDKDLVVQSLAEIRTVRFLSGAQVRDENGMILANWGVVPLELARQRTPDSPTNVRHLNEPLVHHFLVNHVDSSGETRVVGELLLVTDFSVLGRNLADRARLIISNYLASTLGLMVILLWALDRFVGRPLTQISRAIEDYRFDRTESGRPPLELPEASELAALWTSFESLTRVLKDGWLQQRVMSAILEEAAVMALVCDDRGVILSSNAQARSRLGGGVPGHHLFDITYGDIGTALLWAAQPSLQAGHPWRQEVEARNEDGQSFRLAAALLPLKLPDQPEARWGVMIEDVTAQRNSDKYRQELALARDSARNKSLFLANLSHEIRTPMNAVMGLTALALQEEVSPRAREFLTQLQRSGASLLRVINDILDYAKLEEHKVELETVEVSPRELLLGIEALFGFQAEDKGLELRVRVARSAPRTFLGDPLRIHQILANLVSNAVKFTERGRIEISIQGGVEAGRVRFEVRDSGPGIAAADQHRLFQSFSQVDPSTTRKYGGTGLGLAICQSLVELMHGQVGVESELGKGTLFWVEIPAGSSERAPVSDRGVDGLRVLVAEDNAVNQLVAREILTRAGASVIMASNGAEALEKVSAGGIDIVLMDLQMPVMDGLEATRILRKTYRPEVLPILALTAHTFAEERTTCLNAGMQDLVAKPVNPPVLIEMVSRWRPQGPKTEPGDDSAPADSE